MRLRPTEGSEFQHLADRLLPAVMEAGRIQLHYRRAGVAVLTKADATPVTLADQESEAVLLEGLSRFDPGVPVVAEEASAAGAMPDVGRRFYLVDPLDGTKEFIAGRGEFTINVALVESGRPVFGLIYAPVLEELTLTLGRAQAVHCRLPPDSTAQRIGDLCPLPIHVRTPDLDRLAATVSFSHMNAETDAFLARFRIAERHAAGSSLKFCLIAEGKADIYPRLGPTSEWDIAAGHAILNAAGGTVTRLDGGSLRYGKVADRFRNPHYVAWGAPKFVPPAA
jgi:3'(2'),5'-bisphosphate nucleotidase